MEKKQAEPNLAVVTSQGFLLTSSLSSGFSGLTTAFVEHVRDEFPKTVLWSTGLLENSRGWRRSDSEASGVSLGSLHDKQYLNKLT